MVIETSRFIKQSQQPEWSSSNCEKTDLLGGHYFSSSNRIAHAQTKHMDKNGVTTPSLEGRNTVVLPAIINLMWYPKGAEVLYETGYHKFLM